MLGQDMRKTITFLIEKGEANYKKIFAAIFLAQLFFLLLAYRAHGVVYQSDSGSYITPAKNLLAVGRLLDWEGNPILFRTPGYSAFLAVVYFLTGYSDAVVVWLQIVMVLAITWMIFSLASRIGGKKLYGCLACFFYATDLSVYTHVVCIMTDTIFPFLLTAAFFLFYQYQHNKKVACMVSSILLLNIAMLVRPQNMYYNMILAGTLVVLAFLRKVRWRECVFYCLVFALAYGGWSFRNYCAHGEPVFTSIQEKNYLDFYAPLTYALVEGKEFEDAQAFYREMLDEKYPNYEMLSPIERLHADKDVGGGAEYVRSHFMAYLLVNLRGLGIEMVGPSRLEIYSWGLPVLLTKLICCAFAGGLLLSYLVYAAGFLKTLKKQTWLDWLILLTVMYLMASTAVLGYSRYRLAFYPLCVIGAFSCWKGKEYAKV